MAFRGLRPFGTCRSGSAPRLRRLGQLLSARGAECLRWGSGGRQARLPVSPSFHCFKWPVCLVVPVVDSVSVGPWVAWGAVLRTSAQVHSTLPTLLFQHVSWAVTAHALTPRLTQAGFSPLQAKVVIRELLPSGLRESISKVRSSVAYAVSAIAHWDWSEAWPQLFNLLMGMLVSGDVNAVHGAMRVLTGTGATPWPHAPPIPPGSHFDAARPRQGPSLSGEGRAWQSGMQTAVHSPASLDPTCSPLEPELSWCVKLG